MMWLYLFALLPLYFLRRWYRERQTVPNLTEKYVVITGCDTGFGSLVARQLDQRGLRVLATCLTQKGAEQLKEATSQRLQTIITDVTDHKSVTAMAQWVKQQVGDRGLWGVVNNAGVSVPAGPNEWQSKTDFQRVLDVNLLGLIDVTLSLTPMVRKARGRIVNVASSFGRIALTGGAYCISKYGVEAFSDSLRRELRHFGVKVSMLEPGLFRTAITDTDIIQKNLIRLWENVSPEIKQSYGQAYFEESIKKAELGKISNSNLSLVTDCMEHGLIAVYPRTRYTPGWDAKLFFLPLSYMPTAWVDGLLGLWSLKPADAI